MPRSIISIAFTLVVVLSEVSHSVPSHLRRRYHRLTGHAATIATLSYAIRFWSKGTKRALFLRHEGFLCVNGYKLTHNDILTHTLFRGAIGAWIKNIENNPETATSA